MIISIPNLSASSSPALLLNNKGRSKSHALVKNCNPPLDCWLIGCEKEKNLGLLTRYLTAIQPKTGIILLGTIADIKIMLRIRIRIRIMMRIRIGIKIRIRIKISMVIRINKIKIRIRIMIMIRIRIRIRKSMRDLLRLRTTQMRRPKKERICN